MDAIECKEPSSTRIFLIIMSVDAIEWFVLAWGYSMKTYCSIMCINYHETSKAE